MVRLRDMPGFKAVMGYRYIDDIVLEQERQRQQLEQALSTATTNSEIVDSISKIYWLIYRMDLVSGIYEEVSAGQEMHRLTGKWGRTDQVFQEVRETIVAQEHQEQMRRFLDTSTLPQRLRDTESVAMDLPDASAVPIFAMTANAFPEDMALSRHAGMNEHLSKPLRENELLKTIRRYVKSRSC